MNDFICWRGVDGRFVTGRCAGHFGAEAKPGGRPPYAHMPHGIDLRYI